MKIYEDNKIRLQRYETAPLKNDKRKIDRESLQLHSLIKKAAEKLVNKISNFEELDCQKFLNINKLKLKKNLIMWTK